MSDSRACVVKAKLGQSKLVLFAVMIDGTKEPPSANDLPEDPSLRSELQAARAETSNRKRIESEGITHDIGFERALTEWIIQHRSKWWKSRQPERNSTG